MRLISLLKTHWKVFLSYIYIHLCWIYLYLIFCCRIVCSRRLFYLALQFQPSYIHYWKMLSWVSCTHLTLKSKHSIISSILSSISGLEFFILLILSLVNNVINHVYTRNNLNRFATFYELQIRKYKHFFCQWNFLKQTCLVQAVKKRGLYYYWKF